MLIGRERECEQLDELLDRARLGRSGALVIRGEAGVGKSALLDHAAARAVDARIVRTLGVESEVELELSGLLDVCRPLESLVDELPEARAAALRAALGEGPAHALDRYAIGAATLGLLAAAAEQRPLLVLVDDAQWVDAASADALLFAARRLDADSVVVLFAAREDDGPTFEAPGIPELEVEGLDLDGASALLRAEGVADASVVSRLHQATGGNPLALVELVGELSEAQLAGREPLAEPLPAGSAVERSFARRAEGLPDATRKALLTCAVSRAASPGVILRAFGALGLEASALEPAEDAGLVTIRDGRVDFTHPLVRSAVYHAAQPSERRGVHRVLADAAGDASPEERAWHLAAAALGPDEDAAAALEDAAVRARDRSGYAAAASALERAARLTPDPEPRSRRLAAAADAAWEAGRGAGAAELLDEALAITTDPVRAPCGFAEQSRTSPATRTPPQGRCSRPHTSSRRPTRPARSPRTRTRSWR